MEKHDWETFYKKYKIKVSDNGDIEVKGKTYPKHIVDVVETVTERLFPVPDSKTADVYIAFQLSILDNVVL